MSWVGIAVSVGGSLLSGAMSSNAVGEAAGAQSEAAGAASAQLKYARNEGQNALAPYTGLGRSAASALSQGLGLGNNGYDSRVLPNGKTVYDEAVARYQALLDADQPGASIWDDAPETVARHIEGQRKLILQENGLPDVQPAGEGSGSLTKDFTEDDLNKDVVYNKSLQFGLDEGLKAVNRGAAAKGSLDSGAALKGIARYATDYAGTKATDAYNRYKGNQSQIYGMLSGTAGLGAGAASTSANLAANMGQNQANLSTQAGNSAAAGIIGQSNAMGSGISGAVNSYQQNKLLAALTGGGARTGGSYGGSNYQTGAGDIYGGMLPNGF